MTVNPYTGRTLLQFNKACIHTMHMIDYSTRAINSASGVEDFLMLRNSPFSPARLYAQFAERASSILPLTRLDMPSVDPVYLETVQCAVSDEVLPALSVAGEGWTRALTPFEAYLRETSPKIDMNDVAEGIKDTAEGLLYSRNEITMNILPNLRFLLTDHGIRPS